ncbi:MAG: helix-turn-helix domain-containing protein [Candidatus Marinimicrobia bacterium]|jgi:putative molybdopterin biosynthesis protein|nr:helix-turn-helix domain-containing protein [Flavobacteriales bacterium]MBT6631433.1 helix-turn-helix domain-containing protein [Candidatus Neomarinimicrobiota bacterium]MBT6940667.1 helix-turn-helix domain-containing protein [Candidatus Neomarinimicrobiota bacterium]
MIDNLLTPKEVASFLSINYHKVLELIHRGKIKSYKIDRQFRVSHGQLNEYLTKSSHKPHRIHNLI